MSQNKIIFMYSKFLPWSLFSRVRLFKWQLHSCDHLENTDHVAISSSKTPISTSDLPLQVEFWNLSAGIWAYVPQRLLLHEKHVRVWLSLGRQHKDTNFGDFQDNSQHFCNKCSFLATNYYNYSRATTFGHGTNSMSNLVWLSHDPLPTTALGVLHHQHADGRVWSSLHTAFPKNVKIKKLKRMDIIKCAY